MKVTLAQRKHGLGDKEENLEIIESTVEETDSDLVIFPEMFLTGYSLKDRLWDEAEEIPGPSSYLLSDLAANEDTNIICGMPEYVPNLGKLYNSAVLVDSRGDIHTYRKSYLANFGPFDEVRYFRPDDSIPVFDTPIGKIGIVICYDLFFPELTKTLAMKDAEIITCISASPSTTREYFEKVMFGRAIETTSFVLYSNLVGREDDMTFWGGDSIIDPKGKEIAKGPYFEEGMVSKEIDMDKLDGARRGRPALSDTRPEILSKMADQTMSGSK